jgi:hypothetical protein
VLKVDRSFGVAYRPNIRGGTEDGGYVSPKRRLTFNGVYGVISQKTELYMTIALLTSDPILILHVYTSNEYATFTIQAKQFGKLLLYISCCSVF